jgi:hypothetical protein
MKKLLAENKKLRKQQKSKSYWDSWKQNMLIDEAAHEKTHKISLTTFFVTV